MFDLGLLEPKAGIARFFLQMSQAFSPSPARPAVVLGLTFLLVGLTFALPFSLVPSAELSVLSGRFSPEVANVYACVAWSGWAHFVFAFRGQGKGLSQARDDLGSKRLALFGACVTGALLLLLGLREVIGATVFGAVAWVYFIDHFLKAEEFFEGKPAAASVWSRWITSYQPLVAFTWLSVVLLDVGGINSHAWLRLGISLALAAVVLLHGGWRNLTSGVTRSPLLALFFVAEALVWGTFSRYGGPVFMTGVYVFHIAAGSYFHYLGSYFAANARAGSKDPMLHPLSILAVNVAIVALGFGVARGACLRWLTPVLGVQWFTLWVALHLVSSDIFPIVKRRGLPTAALKVAKTVKN